jgi:hypothetical protein
MNFRKKLGFALVFAFIVIVLTGSATMVAAEDGWHPSVGIGVYLSNVYLGSNDYYLAPIPMAQTSYTKGDVSISLSLLDGLGMMYSNQQSGFSGSFTLTYGDERDSEEYSVMGIAMDHSDNTKKLLKDSPTVSTSVSVKAMLGYLTPIGTFGASIEYHPTKVQYGQYGQEDTDYNGYLYSLAYSIEHPVTEKPIITAKLGVEFMNQD